MMSVIKLCRDTLSRDRLLATVLGSASTLALATVNVRSALYVSAAVFVMLTLATAAALPLYKFTGKQGVEAVYFTLSAMIAMSFATLSTHFDLLESDSVAKVMVLTVAGGFIAGRVPESDASVVSPILDSVVTGAVFALISVSMAVVRELLAYGTLAGRSVADISLPIAERPAFGLMMLGVVAMLINVIFVVIRSVRLKMNNREKEVTASDE